MHDEASSTAAQNHTSTERDELESLEPRLESQEFQEACNRAHRGDPVVVSVRTLLSWFSTKRRRKKKVEYIRHKLEENRLATEPDFELPYIDAEIRLVARINPPANNGELSKARESKSAQDLDQADAGSEQTRQDPTYGIRRLEPANKKPVCVNREATLMEAMTKMQLHSYSTLPVMQSSRHVQGILTWQSIAIGLAAWLANKPGRTPLSHPVSGFMESKKNEITADTCIFEAIPGIIAQDYVLVKDRTNIVCGMVTPTDLAQQFKELGTVFLRIGEIENHLRQVIDAYYSSHEVSECGKERNSSDPGPSRASDLAFGGYVRLLEEPSRWSRLDWSLDRKTFIDALNNVREIRNNAMHFDPDGLDDDEREHLAKFVELLRRGIKQLVKLSGSKG